MKKTTKILVSALLLASMGLATIPAVLPTVQEIVLADYEEDASYTVRYDENGKARIYDQNGNQVRSGWYEVDGERYYINDYGAGVVKCWRDGTDGLPRYLKADGTMAHDEWIQDYGNWYYLLSDGTRATPTVTLNGVTYHFDLDGAWMNMDDDQTTGPSSSGTSTDSDYTVRYDENGKARIYDQNGNQVRSGWYEVDGERYYINDYGAGVVKCWRDGTDGLPRYLKADGTMAHDEWIQDYGNWYYLLSDGTRATPTVTLNGVTYHFDLDGAWMNMDDDQTTGPSSSGTSTDSDYTVRYDENGKARIYDEDGNQMRSGWYESDGEWYYINDYGASVVKCWRLKDGQYRYLKANGQMAHNEWIQDYGDWYYLKSDGTRYESSWATIGGHRYWFGGSGKMMADGWLTLADGNTYYFYPDGHMASSETIDGHRVDENGVLQENTEDLTGTIYDTMSSRPVSARIRFTDQNGKTYCYADGQLAVKRWIGINGNWYLTGDDGSLYKSQWIYVGFEWENYWYWFDSTGRMYTDGWLTLSDGNTYYLYSNGHMAANTTIDGHRIDNNGVRVS